MISNPNSLSPTFWLQVVQGLATFLLAAYIYISNKNSATSSQISENRKATAKVDTDHNLLHSKLVERLAMLEGGLKHLPTASQFSKLQATVAETRGGIDAMASSLNQINATVAQLLENELAEGRDQKTKGRR